MVMPIAMIMITPVIAVMPITCTPLGESRYINSTYSSDGGYTDDLPGYLSCNNLTCHDKLPSLLDLQDSFDFDKKALLSNGMKTIFGHQNPDITPFEEVEED